MPTMLLKNAATLLTMDPRQPLIQGGGLSIWDNVIEAAGPSADLPQQADIVLDASGMIVLPGLINTHHHLYQTLTRARPAADLGIRFHPPRGSMSLGQSAGGLPPDRLVEAEDAILADCQRVIQRHHDPEPYSMLRVGLAPCSPFSVTGDLMREAAALARSYEKVYLHTHVAETQDEERFCLEQFGVRPAEYMRQLGWVGPDVWWAHAVWLDEAEIQMLAETGTGVAHCPSSNMRLGSGIAKIRQMRQSGVKVGIALDGS